MQILYHGMLLKLWHLVLSMATSWWITGQQLVVIFTTVDTQSNKIKLHLSISFICHQCHKDTTYEKKTIHGLPERTSLWLQSLVFVYLTSVKGRISITKTRLYSQSDVLSGSMYTVKLLIDHHLLHDSALQHNHYPTCTYPVCFLIYNSSSVLLNGITNSDSIGNLTTLLPDRQLQ